ncbi:MAG TPA: hypothetical protein VN736_05925 [Candidatus Limnocylindrales bacterium]|nr:hypothetical protein [Candidatus Limnocylindrales bacterium]
MKKKPRQGASVTKQKAVPLIAAEEYARITDPQHPAGTFAQFFAKSPLRGSGIKLDRERDFGREIEL